MNHLGKLAFRWMYWNALLPARPLPISNQMSMVGKRAIRLPDKHIEEQESNKKAA